MNCSRHYHFVHSVLGLYSRHCCFHEYSLGLIPLVGIHYFRCLKLRLYTLDDIHHKMLGYDHDKHLQDWNHFVRHRTRVHSLCCNTHWHVRNIRFCKANVISVHFLFELSPEMPLGCSMTVYIWLMIEYDSAITNNLWGH